MSVIFGFDPGGISGVAVGWPQPQGIRIETTEVHSVEGAIEWLRERAGKAFPQVVGIDAFLWWSCTKSGWRRCDRWLRDKYPAVKASVLCTNNTYGSMAVQGMSFAIRVREIWPEVSLNEVHPKVLMYALADCPYPRGKWPSNQSTSACAWLTKQGCQFSDEKLPVSEHEFDAGLAVWASYQGLHSWQGNLAELNDEKAIFPAGPVQYFWPDDVVPK